MAAGVSGWPCLTGDHPSGQQCTGAIIMHATPLFHPPWPPLPCSALPMVLVMEHHHVSQIPPSARAPRCPLKVVVPRLTQPSDVVQESVEVLMLHVEAAGHLDGRCPSNPTGQLWVPDGSSTSPGLPAPGHGLEFCQLLTFCLLPPSNHFGIQLLSCLIA